jgi:hypothetical protein
MGVKAVSCIGRRFDGVSIDAMRPCVCPEMRRPKLRYPLIAGRYLLFSQDWICLLFIVRYVPPIHSEFAVDLINAELRTSVIAYLRRY